VSAVVSDGALGAATLGTAGGAVRPLPSPDATPN
jgi:hypothetical protein